LNRTSDQAVSRVRTGACTGRCRYPPLKEALKFTDSTVSSMNAHFLSAFRCRKPVGDCEHGLF
jgi:hypothetical protein